MFVGAARIVLEFHNYDNPAKKSRELAELCAAIRKQFNVSCLEIADQDSDERGVIGFAAVMPENWKESSARSLMEKICETIDQTATGRVSVEDWEILEAGREADATDESPYSEAELRKFRKGPRRFQK